MAMYALAKIADPASESAFAAAVEKSGYKYEKTDAVASYVRYAEQLMANGQKDAANNIAKKLLTKANLVRLKVVSTYLVH
ncbi:hypothetical protein D3C79_870130 [compost metagenome]